MKYLLVFKWVKVLPKQDRTGEALKLFTGENTCETPEGRTQNRIEGGRHCKAFGQSTAKKLEGWRLSVFDDTTETQHGIVLR